MTQEEIKERVVALLDSIVASLGEEKRRMWALREFVAESEVPQEALDCILRLLIQESRR